MTSSDPVAAKSTFLCMYMSNHPDTLVSYVKHYGKVSDSTITNAQLTSIDSNSMLLSYQSDAGKSQVRIPFDPPLSGYEEVKPRLLSMKVDAEESLGMTHAPQITVFHLPRGCLPVLLVVLVAIYVSLAPPPSTLNLPVYWLPGSLVRNFVGGTLLKFAWALFFFIHFLESLYTLLLVRRHKTGFLLGAAYVIATFMFGQPVWSGIRKRVHAARIESIMKGK